MEEVLALERLIPEIRNAFAGEEKFKEEHSRRGQCPEGRKKGRTENNRKTGP